MVRFPILIKSINLFARPTPQYMLKVPIKFDYKGSRYAGVLSAASGSSGLYHLLINNYFQGQLFYSDHWQFYSNKNMFAGMAEFFGSYLIAWTDSNS